MQQDKPQENQAWAAMPDKKVFAGKGQDVIQQAVLAVGQRFHIYERTEYPEDDGILIYFKGLPYPKKGFPYPEAVYANDLAKRTTLTLLNIFAQKDMALSLGLFLFLPWKRKIKVIENIIHNWSRIMSWQLDGHTLTPERYTSTTRELFRAIAGFFTEIGIDYRKAEAFALYVETMVEYDDMYRYRIEDIVSELSEKNLYENPRKEMCRLLDIYISREKTHANETGKMIKRIVSLLLLHPKIKRAFLKTVPTIRWSKMILDNADRYHVLLVDGYNFTGRTFEERKKIYEDFHRDKNIPYPPMIEIKSHE